MKILKCIFFCGLVDKKDERVSWVKNKVMMVIRRNGVEIIKEKEKKKCRKKRKERFVILKEKIRLKEVYIKQGLNYIFVKIIVNFYMKFRII